MHITIWILGDQLVKEHPALLAAQKSVSKKDITILLIQSQTQANRYPYHIRKLTFLYSAMQHYAEEHRSEGYPVKLIKAKNTVEGFKNYLNDCKTSQIFTMAASSKRGRSFQENLSERIEKPVKIFPNTQFLCEQFDPFPDVDPGSTIRQEKFYREMRKHFNLLLDDKGAPVQGKWNFDEKNRQSLPQDHQPPGVIQFEPGSVTQRVMKDILDNYQTIGSPEGFDLAVNRDQANQAAKDFFDNRLSHFGTYEDAMSTKYGILYHSMLSPYINVGLLDPLDLAKTAEKAYKAGIAELNNVEGFIRQVIGWREYMYWQYHRFMPELPQVSFGTSSNRLPRFFWDGKTDMNCLKHVIDRVLQSGYCHHIERLMIVSNFCLLAGISPQEVYDWFSSAFIDAYEWVMLPNVYGMGLYADGGKIATKPYISSANYINKMSNYCSDCTYNKNARTGAKACPYNFLYWQFLIKNQNTLESNHRMARMLYHLKNFNVQDKKAVAKCSDQFLQDLQ